MSPRRSRQSRVVVGVSYGKWVVFDMLTRRQVEPLDRELELSLAKVKNAEDRLKRSLANAVQLEMVDS